MYLIQFPQLSNRASWPFVGELTDLDDVPIDLTGYAMQFAIYDRSGGLRLVASTANGKMTVVGLGQFRWNFTLQEMESLCSGTYNTGLQLTTPTGDQTVQLSVGPLPIIDGFVPA